MQRVIVIGCPGAGKSTFSRALRDRLGLPLYYLDMLWHREDKTTVEREEFDRRVAEILAEEEWIIDGNYLRTMEMRMKRCDTVFFLDYPLELCLEGVRARIGKKREDMPWVEEELDEEFRQWIEDFPRTQLPYLYELLDQYRAEKQVFVFKSRQEAGEYLNSV
ncbi:MAG: AAA family ATPase [Lachnospiraceae bacterium]|nr:AAA family ATPase [Lachnospiraceae bacterium]